MCFVSILLAFVLAIIGLAFILFVLSLGSVTSISDLVLIFVLLDWPCYLFWLYGWQFWVWHYMLGPINVELRSSLCTPPSASLASVEVSLTILKTEDTNHGHTLTYTVHAGVSIQFILDIPVKRTKNA